MNILIADDHELLRRGIKSIIEAHPGWTICGEAGTGREAVAQAEKFKPDAVVMDVSMPKLNGLEAARQIRKVSPQTAILILSVHYSDQLIHDLVEIGVRGYVVKSDSDRHLVTALEAFAQHKTFFTPKATEVLLANSTNGRAPGAEKSSGSRLTPREREVVALLSKGHTSKEVANVCGVSVKTVETHRANVMRKLELHCVTDLVRYAVRNQLVEA